jgi:hypothetical protein
LGSHGPSHGGPRTECQDQQCAEQECDPEEFGDELRGPREKKDHICGIDRRPLLPVVLIVTTMGGALQFIMLEFPLARDLFAGASYLRAAFIALYVMTLGCLFYCALCDPGQLNVEDQRKGLLEGGVPTDEKEQKLPERAHKMWLYKQPIRRYDHYCRWVTNAIGLLNHREFIIMVSGLVTIGVLGGLFDLLLLISMPHDRRYWLRGILVILHLMYSAIVTALAGPILRLHVGFVSRNELANEWKKNEFYIALIGGKRVPVNDLNEYDFNDHFDFFVYDPSRNPFDRGFYKNCFSFWCTTRWTPTQTGGF